MIKLNKNQILLVSIVSLAAFLRLFRLIRVNMITDAAAYAFRSVGYLDYLDWTNQTTPIIWFGFRPWWSYLSFHDLPPLIPLIQHIFFTIFGITTLNAVLPFALSGIGSVILIYLLAKKLYGRNFGYLAAFLLAICTYHVWISRIGYVESILIFFVLLTVYYFIKALEKDKYFIHFGIFLGLSFLCKYTAFFLIPAIVFYLLFYKRDIFRNKKFWIGIFLCLIIFSPIIIYNLMMYQTRGHFDLQFAALFEQDMSDWPAHQKQVSKDFFGQLANIWNTLRTSFSPVIFYLFIPALGFILYLSFAKKGKYQKHWLIILLLVFLTIFSVLTKVADYFISVYAPFVILVVSYFLIKLITFFKAKQRFILIFLLIFSAIYTSFFTINTNLLHQTKGQERVLFSKIRMEGLGFNQLEDFLENRINIPPRSIHKIKTVDDIYLDASRINPEVVVLFIYDEDINWFASIWHVMKRFVYQRVLFLSVEEFFSANQKGTWSAIRSKYRDVYFIKGANEDVLDAAQHRAFYAEELEKIIIEQTDIEPLIIKNPKGEAAFKIYKI